MFESKALDPPDNDLAEVKTQIGAQRISSVKSNCVLTDFMVARLGFLTEACLTLHL